MVAGLVGRDLEMAALAAFVGERSGFGALVLEGAPGMGKTTLWSAARDRADERGCRVLQSRSVEAEAALAFVGLADLLDGVVDELLPVLPLVQRQALETALLLSDGGPEVDHRAVGAATRGALQHLSRRQPVVVALDDLHWLDPSSTRALAYAFRRLRDEPVRLLASVRTGMHGATDVFESIAPVLVERTVLGPLSVGAIARILADHLDLHLPRTTLVRLHEVAAGNPFYAIEIGRALAAEERLPDAGQALPVPEDLRELLLRRVQDLDAEAREVLLLGALLSDPSVATLHAAVGDTVHERLERAEAAGIVRVAGGAVRFDHPLLAAAVSASASERQRRSAHARLATAVRAEDERARHIALAAAGPDEEVAATLDAAAKTAARRGAADAAAELAELAVSLSPDPTGPGTARRHLVAADARFVVGDTARASAHLDAAAAVVGPGADRARVLWRLGRVLYTNDDVPGALAVLQEGLVEAEGDDVLSATIEHDLAVPLFYSGDLEGTHRHSTAAAERAERCGAQHILADALGQLVVTSFFRGEGFRADLADRALDLEDWDVPRPVPIRPSPVVSHVLSWCDRFDECRRLLEFSERNVIERGDDMALPFLGYRFAELDVWEGHWERGAARAAEARRLADQIGQRTLQTAVLYVSALIAAHQGDEDGARSFARIGTELALATRTVLGAGLNASVLGFLELSLGHPDRADAVLGPMLAAVRARGTEEPAPIWWLADEIEALIALDRRSEAEELVAWLAHRSAVIDRPRGLAAAARCRALLAGSLGETQSALASCDEALLQLGRVRAPFDRARTVFAKGQLARRGRKWGIARSALGEAATAFDDLGARLWADRARDELARTGGRRPATSDLSDSERQVAALVAEGRSNREVAEALYLSPRTVSSTLERVYRKLGVGSRTELANHMALRDRS